MEFLSGLFNWSSDGAPRDGSSPFMAPWPLLWFKNGSLEDLLRGEVCVEDGGEQV